MSAIRTMPLGRMIARRADLTRAILVSHAVIQLVLDDDDFTPVQRESCPRPITRERSGAQWLRYLRRWMRQLPRGLRTKLESSTVIINQ